jgi:DNA repair photolyase
VTISLTSRPQADRQQINCVAKTGVCGHSLDISTPAIQAGKTMRGDIIINDDGVSVKGCSIIYAPRGQAGEYAALATNPYRGCGHSCCYCYVPDVLRMSRPEFDAGAIVRNGILAATEKDAKKYRSAGITEQVMLSFTTDPFHPGDTVITTKVLEILIEHGLGMCTLTKGGTRALRDIDLFRPKRDAFASTLTSLDDRFSQKWERKAALPADRLAALRTFHERGIFTWVSLEPTLDLDASLALVDATHQFVDLYKVGRANYVPTITKVLNWEDYTHRMIDKLHQLRKAHYIKKDLQRYLPPGYLNPLRVPQHH